MNNKSYRKVPSEIVEDFGQLLDEIIDTLVVENGMSAEIAMVLLSKYYNVSMNDIKECLKIVSSKFTANNNVIFYDTEKSKYIKRTTLLSQIGTLYTKIGTRLKRVDENMDPTAIFETIETTYA